MARRPLPTDHGVSATRAGGFLAAANAVNVAGQFISAAVEDLLQRKGYSLLTIRRIGAGGGSFTQAVCVTLFGLAPSPLLASVIFSAHNLAESFTSNGCELSATVCHQTVCLGDSLDGGSLSDAGRCCEQTRPTTSSSGASTARRSTPSATCASPHHHLHLGRAECSTATQALANVPGFAIAALGALVRQRTGSLLPLFGGIAVFQGLGAIAYTRLATTTVLD